MGCGRKAFEKLHDVTELELLRRTKEELGYEYET